MEYESTPAERGETGSMEVAKITNRTLLVVEPPEKKKGERKGTKTVTNAVLNQKSRKSPFVGSTLLGYIAPYSSVQSLRVLPQYFRYCNTSYLVHANGEHREEQQGDGTSPNPLEDSLLEQFLDDKANLFTNIAPKHSLAVIPDDDNTAIVHPLYLKAAIDLAVCTNKASSPLSEENGHLHGIFTNESLKDLHLIGQLFKHKSSPTEPSILVKILVSETVRPGHVSISQCVRSALQIETFDRVFLRIIDDRVKSPIFPSSISIQFKQDHKSGDNILDKAQKEAVRAAFIRLVDQETPSEGFFLLAEGQLLNLSLPADLFESTALASTSSLSSSSLRRPPHCKQTFSVKLTASKRLSQSKKAAPW